MSPFSFRIRPLVRPSFPTPGGDEEVRTPDPLRARQVLSQLSYTPIFENPFPRAFKIKHHLTVLPQAPC